MKDHGTPINTGSQKAPSDLVVLYRRAFAEFRSRAMWNIREFEADGRPVQPDPSRVDTYATHAPRRRGHWPSSPDITAAMLERLWEIRL
jgi:hypothetical protein